MTTKTSRLRPNFISFTTEIISMLLLSMAAGFGASLELVPPRAVWKYYDGGTDLGTAWRSPTYDDGGWASGPAELGYGDGLEATIVSYGPNSEDKFVTTYFRHTFQVADAGAISGLALEVLRDDGAVVYLNGTQIASYSMPSTFSYGTYALTAADYPWDPPLSVPAGLLVSGDNVLAVEVHQCNATSTDLSLDLRLTGTIDLRVALQSPADGATGVPVPATLTATPTHPSGQPTTVTFYGRQAAEPSPDFNIVVLPDIQKYTAQVNGGSVAILDSQIQFILENRQASNIVYVTQLGDVSDNGDSYESQWMNASSALYQLESATPEIPYGAAVGNHDQLVPSGDTSPTTYYNQYFGVSHFQGRSYYGGHFGDNNNNHFDLFSASGLDFIAIYLEFDSTPDPAVLAWADSLLKTYPGRRGMVVTHYLLETTAVWGAQGTAIYDSLKDNPNLFLMLCGHNAGEARRTDVYANNTVYTLLADYQGYANGGNGFLRVLHFSPGRNAIYVRTYSPWLKQYENDATSAFTLSYEMGTGPTFGVIGQNPGVASATPTTATWSGLLPGTRYEWFAEASDGFQSAVSEIRDFTTLVTAPPSVSLTAPNEGRIFETAPAEVALTATAADPDGTIARVEFFAGSTSLGSDSEEPYEAPTPTTLNTGAYTLTAVATDNDGAQTVSAPVHITVGTVPLAPVRLIATAKSRTSVDLSWTDNSDNEDGFGIYRSTDGASYALIGTLTANETSASVTGLTPATTYSFLVRAFNALGYADSAAATVTTAANGSPAGQADAFDTLEEAALSIASPGVLANDTDPDNDPLSAVLVAGPAHGMLTLRADGSFDYSPALNFSGSDMFTYMASDGNANSAPTTVTITVGAINDAPVANPDTATTIQGAGVVINVLANDIDQEGSGLALIAATPGASGNATINPNNTVTYRPTAEFTGPDTFTYTISDGTATAIGTVTVTVTPNVLFSDGFESGNFTAGGWTITGTASVDVTAKNSGSYGALLKKTSTITKAVSGIAATTVKLSYARRAYGLDAGEFGFTETSFDGVNWTQLEAVSGTAAWETKTFDLTPTSSGLWLRFGLKADAGNDMFMVDDVAISGGTPLNTAPTTLPDSYAIDEDTTLAVPAAGVLANDVDSDGDAVSAVLADGPQHGTLTLNADGSFSYAPYGNFAGVDMFSYRADDGLAQSDATTVTLTVRPLNDAPVGAADTYSIDQDSRLDVTAPGLLGNDTDVDGDAFTVVSASLPANGTLTFNSNGSFTYTPAADFTGTDSFQYTVADGQGGTATATVTINVVHVNHAPIAADDSCTVVEDSSVSVASPGVLGNDSDSDSDKMTAVLATTPAHGTLTFNADGSFTYTPNGNFSGTDSFTYKATDDFSESAAATVTINVTGVNDTPVVVPDSYVATRDISLIIAPAAGVLANDTDIDSMSLTVSLFSGPLNGALTLDPDGSFRYTPIPGFVGTDSFQYKATDDQGGESTAAVVSITVQLVNTAPVSVEDAYSTAEDTPLQVAAPGVLANDSDAEEDALTAVQVGVPASGTLALNPNGSFTYTPNANFNGTDSFSYKANDGRADSGIALVTITVDSANDAPTANAQSATVEEDGALNLTLTGTDPDGEVLTCRALTEPSHGTLVLDPAGTATYTPLANFHGSDAFTFEVEDPAGIASQPATVSITIIPINDVPVAYGQSAELLEDGSININLSGEDADGDTLIYNVLTPPSHGTLTGTAPQLIYAPDANYNGTDSLVFQVDDGRGGSGSAVVTINVTAVNDAPVAAADFYVVTQNTALNIAAAAGVLANDRDIDSPSITARLVSGPANGAVTLNPDGSFGYTPREGYVGTDTFQYKAADGQSAENTAVVTIVVQRVNTAPVSVGDTYSTTEDTSLQVADLGVLANDSDANGDPLTAVLVTGTANGTVALNPDGTFIYTPNANFNGADSFTYKASDGTADSGVAVVTITVISVNDRPVAGSDAYTTTTDGALTVLRASGVLANDSDIDSASLNATVLSGPTSGSLMLAGDGSFTYTPNAGFVGTDAFTYTVADGDDGTATGTVSILVQAPSTTMHVASIVVTAVDAGKGKKRGQAEVIIVDAAGNPVADAIVEGSFSEALSEDRSATTGSDGKAVLQTIGTGRAPQLTFTVTRVSKSGWTYDPAANVETSDKNY